MIGGALAVALLIRTFLFQAYEIPSPSMVDTLEIGDRVLVNKLSYKLHDIHRGDVVVFKRPPGEPDPNIKDLIKRVIGLPGETLEFKDCHVYVGGQALVEPYTEGQCTDPPQSNIDPDGDGKITVPSGMVFVMGDNRERQLRQPLLRPDHDQERRRTGLRDHVADRPLGLAVATALSRAAAAPRGRSWPGPSPRPAARRHPIDPVAEDAVDPEVERGAEQVLVLEIPGEAAAVEAVEEHDQPSRPLGVVEVDRRRSARSRSVAARRSGPSFMRSSRVEFTSWTSGSRARRRPGSAGPASRATPGAAGPVVALWTVSMMTGPAAGSLTSIETWVVGPHNGRKLRQRRDVSGQRRSRSTARDRPLPPPAPDHTVVIEHGDAVGVSQTSVSSPVAPSRKASVKASRVFSGAWARAPRWAKPMGGSSREGYRGDTAGIFAAMAGRPGAGADPSAGGRFPRLAGVLGIFNSLGGGEVIVILVLALIVLGPEKLPEAIRQFGNIYGELRRMSQGFQTELSDAFDEPLRELRGTAQTVQDAVQQPMTAVSSALTASTTEPARGRAGKRRRSRRPRRRSRRPRPRSRRPRRRSTDGGRARGGVHARRGIAGISGRRRAR